MSDSIYPGRVSRRPQLRSLLDQQRTLGNRAVLRLLDFQPKPTEPEEPPPEPEEPAIPIELPPPRRKWFFATGALAILALLEAARRWFGG
jgi:hypothetical protein